MSSSAEPILRICQTVREDTAEFRPKVAKFLAGDTTPVAFRAYRVPMGIYEQRETGRFMVRVRIGAALANRPQLERLAELSKQYGNGILHVTTRQDIQLHEIDIEDTPDVLEKLLEVGLSSRGGGGNTVRNVTACSRAGVCPKEVFDVAPHAIAAAEYLLADRSSFNLPRKFKLVFSGCAEDCAFASIADLGFFAHQKDGVDGFSVYCGGGLGPNASIGVKVEEFIEAGEIFKVAQAAKQLFDKHGDRAHKHKARLRYVLKRVGADEFIKLYRTERDRIEADGLPYEAPEIRDIDSRYVSTEARELDIASLPNVSPDKTSGRATLRLWLNNGDISADDLVKVALIAEKYGQGLIRTTQQQDILIAGIAHEDIEKAIDELKGLSVDVSGQVAPKAVACAGASTCKLGLCLSRGLADAITSKLTVSELSDEALSTVIRISGCPNSCGHHCISELGLQGRAKRVGGRLVPCYDVLIGGRMHEGDARLAEVIGCVPAARIPDMIAEAMSDGLDTGQLKALVEKYDDFSEESLTEDCYRDAGCDQPFSLAGRGPGECGAGVMDMIKFDIDEAKSALRAAPAADDNVYKAVVAAARSLLVTFGQEPGNDREIFAAFSKHLIESGWVDPNAQKLLDAAVDWRMGDIDSLTDLVDEARGLTQRVDELFKSLDASLKFTVDPVSVASAPEPEQASSNHADLRGVACPMNFVKAKLALEQIEVDDVLEVLLDEGEPVRNAPASFAQQGQEILETTDMGGYFSVKIRRKK
jgi:sulfite reductase (ferredoxin)